MIARPHHRGVGRGSVIVALVAGLVYGSIVGAVGLFAGHAVAGVTGIALTALATASFVRAIPFRWGLSALLCFAYVGLDTVFERLGLVGQAYAGLAMPNIIAFNDILTISKSLILVILPVASAHFFGGLLATRSVRAHDMAHAGMISCATSSYLLFEDALFAIAKGAPMDDAWTWISFSSNDGIFSLAYVAFASLGARLGRSLFAGGPQA